MYDKRVLEHRGNPDKEVLSNPPDNGVTLRRYAVVLLMRLSYSGEKLISPMKL